MQNAQSLAVLGASGGFLAPILASTGGGSHVMLFSYYVMLERGHPRHRLVQGLAAAERAGIRVHVRHRHGLGLRVLPSRAVRRAPSRSW